MGKKKQKVRWTAVEEKFFEDSSSDAPSSIRSLKQQNLVSAGDEVYNGKNGSRRPHWSSIAPLAPRFERRAAAAAMAAAAANGEDLEHLPDGFTKIRSKNLDVLFKRDYYAHHKLDMGRCSSEKEEGEEDDDDEEEEEEETDSNDESEINKECQELSSQVNPEQFFESPQQQQQQIQISSGSFPYSPTAPPFVPNRPNLFLYSPSSNTMIPCEEIIIPNPVMGPDGPVYPGPSNIYLAFPTAADNNFMSQQQQYDQYGGVPYSQQPYQQLQQQQSLYYPSSSEGNTEPPSSADSTTPHSPPDLSMYSPVTWTDTNTVMSPPNGQHRRRRNNWANFVEISKEDPVEDVRSRIPGLNVDTMQQPQEGNKRMPMKKRRKKKFGGSGGGLVTVAAAAAAAANHRGSSSSEEHFCREDTEVKITKILSRNEVDMEEVKTSMMPECSNGVSLDSSSTDSISSSISSLVEVVRSVAPPAPAETTITISNSISDAVTTTTAHCDETKSGLVNQCDVVPVVLGDQEEPREQTLVSQTKECNNTTTTIAQETTAEILPEMQQQQQKRKNRFRPPRSNKVITSSQEQQDGDTQVKNNSKNDNIISSKNVGTSQLYSAICKREALPPPPSPPILTVASEDDINISKQQHPESSSVKPKHSKGRRSDQANNKKRNSNNNSNNLVKINNNNNNNNNSSNNKSFDDEGEWETKRSSGGGNNRRARNNRCRQESRSFSMEAEEVVVVEVVTVEEKPAVAATVEDRMDMPVLPETEVTPERDEEDVKSNNHHNNNTKRRNKQKRYYSGSSSHEGRQQSVGRQVLIQDGCFVIDRSNLAKMSNVAKDTDTLFVSSIGHGIQQGPLFSGRLLLTAGGKYCPPDRSEEIPLKYRQHEEEEEDKEEAEEEVANGAVLEEVTEEELALD